MGEVIALSPTPPSRDSSFKSLDDGYHEKFMQSISALFDDVIEPSETLVDKTKFMDSLRDIFQNDHFLNTSAQSLTLHDLDDSFLFQSSDKAASTTSATQSNTLSSGRSSRHIDASEFHSSLKNLMSSFSDIITNQRAFTIRECEAVKREIVRLEVLRRRMSESERWGPDLEAFPVSAHTPSKEFGKRRALNLEKQKQQLACILAADVKEWKEEELPSSFADEEKRRLREYIEQKYGMQQISKTEGGRKINVRRSILPTSALSRIDEDGVKSPMTPRNRGRLGIRSGDTRRRSLSTPRVERSSPLDRSLSPRRRQNDLEGGKSILKSVSVTPPRKRLSVRLMDAPASSRSRQASPSERTRQIAPPSSPRTRTPSSSRHSRSAASPRSSISKNATRDAKAGKQYSLPSPPLSTESEYHFSTPRRTSKWIVKTLGDRSDRSNHSITHELSPTNMGRNEETKRIPKDEIRHSPRRLVKARDTETQIVRPSDHGNHSPRRIVMTKDTDKRNVSPSDHGNRPVLVRRNSGASLGSTSKRSQHSAHVVGGSSSRRASESRQNSTNFSSLTNHFSRSPRRRGRSCSRSVHSVRSAATGASGSTASSPRRRVRGHSLGASSRTIDRLSRHYQKNLSVGSSASVTSVGTSTVASNSSERRFETSSCDDTTPKTPRRRESTTSSSVGTGTTVGRDNRSRRLTHHSRDIHNTSDATSLKDKASSKATGELDSRRKVNRVSAKMTHRPRVRDFLAKESSQTVV